MPQGMLPATGAAFILRPDPAPAAKYLVTVTVQAFDAQSNLLAIGSESQEVVNKGCNRLSLHLAGLPVAPIFDLSSTSTDMAGMTPPDLAGCIGGSPDEDADGRSNSCDSCPADSDPSPVDSDGDGLPDACDPDPATTNSNNRLLYFEPFDVVNPNWSGDTATTVTQSFINLDPGQPGIVLSNNATDTLPLNVRVQTIIFPKGYYTGGGTIDAGLFVGTNPNPGAPGTSGVLCRLNSTSGSLDILPVQNGTLLTGSSAGLAINAGFYRFRLTQRGNKWMCDATFNGVTTTVQTTQAVTAPLYMSLRAENMFVHFHSVVAETALP
jgi:hypothetical protein